MAFFARKKIFIVKLINLNLLLCQSYQTAGTAACTVHFWERRPPQEEGSAGLILDEYCTRPRQSSRPPFEQTRTVDSTRSH